MKALRAGLVALGLVEAAVGLFAAGFAMTIHEDGSSSLSGFWSDVQLLVALGGAASAVWVTAAVSGASAPGRAWRLLLLPPAILAAWWLGLLALVE